MAVVPFQMTLEDYLRIAADAANENEHLVCLHNLADALRIAKNGKERADVYKCYSDLFAGASNLTMARTALFMSCVEADQGGFYSLDYERFFPDEGDFPWEEDEPLPDSDAILAYNDVYNYISLGNYERALDLWAKLPPDRKFADEIIGVLYDAIQKNKAVDFSEHAYKFLVLAGLYTVRSSEIVRVLLHGSKMTREVMVEGVEFFANEVEDVRVLARIGREFANEGELRCAELCFDKVLEDLPVDDEALYYKAAICYAKGDAEEGKKAWDKYKMIYAPFYAPVPLMERAMFGKQVLPYGKVPAVFVVEDVLVALARHTKGDPDYLRAAEYTLAFANEENLSRFIAKRDLCDEELTGVVRRVLMSPFVGNDRKKYLLDALCTQGYEGRLTLNLSYKGVMCDSVKLSIRKNREIWLNVYRKVSASILCCPQFVPFRASALVMRIKQFDKICQENRIEIEASDVPYLTTVMAADYNRTVRNTTNVLWADILPAISAEEMLRGVRKFPPEVIKF